MMNGVHNRLGCLVLYLLVYASLVYGLAIFINEPSWLILISIVILKLTQTVGGGFAHLTISHAEPVKNRILKRLGALAWLLCGQGSLTHFAYYHTIHHVFSDTEKDPHSPKYGKKWYWWWWTAKDYDQYIPLVQTRIDAIKNEINSDAVVKATNTYYWLFLSSLILLACITPTWFSVYFLCLPFALNFVDGTYFFVKYFHRDGKAKNYAWVNYWIVGKSGLHGAHHKKFK